MSKKRKADSIGFVYSTDPNFQFDLKNEQVETISPKQQKLKIRLETRHRAGKAVTLIEGFIGTEADKEELGKKLRSICGAGGSVKDGEIIIQGDHRNKALQWLLKNNYSTSKII
jgi:translation initiation factor 1